MLIYNDFKNIVTNEIPLIDVRAPIEFARGAFKNTVNLPLMNDEERHLVGICYKEKGNEEAVKLGHRLVSGDVKEARINAWTSYIEKHPNSIIYCFRGGMRSQISQQWINQVNSDEILRLEGGYKSFRNYLLSELEPSKQIGKPILLGGCTGSGKTLLLNKLKNAIDLESIANHRGSSFGKQITPQPTQIYFENNLSYSLIQHRDKEYEYMILEDEGANVGKCFLPKPLASYFNSGSLVILKIPLEMRVKLTMDEYVYKSQKSYIEQYSTEQGQIEWANYIRESLYKIKRRLGGDRCKNVIDLFEQAYLNQTNIGSLSSHEKWIEVLLRDYYDPMYQHQIQKKSDEIIFEGDTDEVLEYLKSKFGK